MEGQVRDAAASAIALCFNVLSKIAFAALTCIFAFCGAFIGAMSGALKGQTTETGLVRGAAVGAVAGAVVSIEVMESCLQGELLSKVAIFDSLLNGKIFREWVCPAMLKAYQWQINALETTHGETSDIFDTATTNGISPEKVNELPEFDVDAVVVPLEERSPCAVCLQDFVTGESARKLPACRHTFHVNCIDRWLLGHGSCPMCRREV